MENLLCVSHETILKPVTGRERNPPTVTNTVSDRKAVRLSRAAGWTGDVWMIMVFSCGSKAANLL